jgi:single-strand DNA-binding protein
VFHVHLVGRLGADAVTRQTPSGQDVANFDVAVDIGYGDKKETEWVRCAVWGKRAVALKPYLTKGQQVSLHGEQKLERFQKKDGSAGAAISVNVSDLALVGGKAQDRGEPPATGSAPAPGQQFTEDDIPF